MNVDGENEKCLSYISRILVQHSTYYFAACNVYAMWFAHWVLNKRSQNGGY